MIKREKAQDIVGRALKLQKKGHLQEAIALYRQAAALLPGWSTPLYNLGLLFKNERKWAEALEYNRQATNIDRKNEAAWWNLGIAATALGDWQTARAAWRGYGIDLPDGTGPIDLPCGFCPIRLNPNGEAEVVWAHRLDPARASLASIPFPESEHRWKDIVLNDGAPTGYRKYAGKEVPVFNALDLLEKSPFGTYVARVQMPSKREYTEGLAEIAADKDGMAEDWSTSVRILCKACSEGRPHKAHDTEKAPKSGVHIIGIAARDRRHAKTILDTWKSGREGIEVESLENPLEPGAS